MKPTFGFKPPGNPPIGNNKNEFQNPSHKEGNFTYVREVKKPAEELVPSETKTISLPSETRTGIGVSATAAREPVVTLEPGPSPVYVEYAPELNVETGNEQGLGGVLEVPNVTPRPQEVLQLAEVVDPENNSLFENGLNFLLETIEHFSWED